MSKKTRRKKAEKRKRESKGNETVVTELEKSERECQCSNSHKEPCNRRCPGLRP